MTKQNIKGCPYINFNQAIRIEIFIVQQIMAEHFFKSNHNPFRGNVHLQLRIYVGFTQYNTINLFEGKVFFTHFAQNSQKKIQKKR